jgi:hypothetical protein
MLQIVHICFGEQFRGESRASRMQFVLLGFIWIDKPFVKQYPFPCLHPISYCIIRILVHQVRHAFCCRKAGGKHRLTRHAMDQAFGIAREQHL